jgi:hypothetical protein
MGAEVGVGPSGPFWIEVVDERNEGGELMEYHEAALDTAGRTTTVSPSIR